MHCTDLSFDISPAPDRDLCQQAASQAPWQGRRSGLGSKASLLNITPVESLRNRSQSPHLILPWTLPPHLPYHLQTTLLPSSRQRPQIQTTDNCRRSRCPPRTTPMLFTSTCILLYLWLSSTRMSSRMALLHNKLQPPSLRMSSPTTLRTYPRARRTRPLPMWTPRIRREGF